MVSSDLVGLFPAKHEELHTSFIFRSSHLLAFTKPMEGALGSQKIGRDIWFVWVWLGMFWLVGWLEMTFDRSTASALPPTL